MCTYRYFHYHHYPPCTRAVEIKVHWVHCKAAIAKAQAAGGCNTPATIEPCAMQQFDWAASIDPQFPCASGGCVASPDCATGMCRLEDLNGRWVCCRCRRGANEFRWCCHPMRETPDTLCYHVCCATCWEDPLPNPIQSENTEVEVVNVRETGEDAMSIEYGQAKLGSTSN